MIAIVTGAIPLVGFLLGLIALFTKPKRMQGVALLVLSIAIYLVLQQFVRR